MAILNSESRRSSQRKRLARAGAGALIAGSAVAVAVMLGGSEFQSSSVGAQAAGTAQARYAERKADRLVAEIGCDGQTWSSIEPQCLVPGDDAARAAARMVTVAYRLGERSSLLVRLPAGRPANPTMEGIVSTPPSTRGATGG